jgi:hypothetical protein
MEKSTAQYIDFVCTHLQSKSLSLSLSHTHIHTHTHTHTLPPNLTYLITFDFLSFYFSFVGRDSSVSIPTRYGLDSPGSNPGEDEIFRTRPDRP